MSLLVLHGWAKTDKIERALRDGAAAGAVLSPRYESPENLADYVQRLRDEFEEATILVDPQFYYAAITPVKAGRLPDYAYFHPDLTQRDFAPSKVRSYVRDTLDFANAMPVSALVSPTVLIEDFNDRWGQIAITLAQETVDRAGSLRNAPPVLLAFVIGESALRSRTSLEGFLDEISLFEVEGFFISVNRTAGTYQAQINETVLENLMYLSHTLGVVNNYQVIFNYMDLVGVALHAAGATAQACGWFNTMRQLSPTTYSVTRGGGRRPAARYTSLALLNSVPIAPVLDEIYQRGRIDEVIVGTQYDAALLKNPGNQPWPEDVSSLHHWTTLTLALKEFLRGRTPQTRIDRLLRGIADAKTLYQSLVEDGIPFPAATGPGHLSQWERAIENFRATLA